MGTVVCTDLDDFESIAEIWDDLWDDSDVQNPNARSRSLASACKRFYNGKILFVVLTENKQVVAAIPFVHEKIHGFVNTLALPNNQWGCWGEILVRRGFERRATYEKLLASVSQATNQNIQLNQIDKSSGQWRQFVSAMRAQNIQAIESAAFNVGIVEHDNHWEQFHSRLSSGFRKKLRKYRRHLAELGHVSFEEHFRFDEAAVRHRFAEAFEVENNSWKDSENTSIAKNEMYEFYLEQAIVLARNNQLRIFLLRLDERVIAFEFGAVGKETYFSWKIGYDAQFGKFAPGQILAEYMTRSFHVSGECKFQDTVGPISVATSKWATRYSKRDNVTIVGKSSIAAIQFKMLQLAKFVKNRMGAPKPDSAANNLALGTGR